MEAATPVEEKTTRRFGLWLLVGLLVLLAARFVWTNSGDDISRIEREHAITLPASVSEAQALGDASGTFVALTGLDRGASSLFLIDRADLEDLLAEFNGEVPAFFGPVHPAPANAVYQPDPFPWPDAGLDRVVGASSSNGDFTNIGIYNVDEDTVGIWIYTDWN